MSEESIQRIDYDVETVAIRKKLEDEGVEDAAQFAEGFKKLAPQLRQYFGDAGFEHHLIQVNKKWILAIPTPTFDETNIVNLSAKLGEVETPEGVYTHHVLDGKHVNALIISMEEESPIEYGEDIASRISDAQEKVEGEAETPAVEEVGT